jgi:glycine dehydrogenase subunit 1
VYLSAVGPEGLREVADLSVTQARHAAAAIESAGLGERRFSAPYFAEVAVRVPDAARRHAALVEQGIVAGFVLEREYPELADTLLLAATELTTDADIATLVAALAATP